nr:energy transducer TonB [uncultured Mucilaginibacter sp.]
MRLLLTLLLLSLSIAGFAQTEAVFLFKNSGKPVDVKDSADYIRIVRIPDSGQVYFNVSEYYKSGKIKLIGQSSLVNPMRFEGQQITYYEKGGKKSLSTYSGGQLKGPVQTYFPNGKRYIVKESSNNFFTEDSIISVFDSLGKQLVTDGNGYYKAYDDDFEFIAAEGTLKGGKRDGVWLFNDKNGRREETYANKKFVKGVNITSEGDTIKYTRRESQPEFKGGVNAFTKFLEKNISYPANERQNNIQGKVFITFTVDKQGNLVDMFIANNPNDALSAEAMRVLKRSPPWSPGIQYGRPVKVQYTVPINFSLGFDR